MTSTRKKAADEISSITREIGAMLTGEEKLGAVGPSLGLPAPANESPSATKGTKAAKKVKFPCGKCDTEATGNAVCCNSCELWFHFACVEGMNKEYFDNCKKMFDLNGYSAFLCKICRKVITALKRSMTEMKDEMKEMADKIVVLELEKETLAQKVEKIEMKAERANERVEGVEREVSTGMEKAKAEVKEDVRSEMALREERTDRFAIYGLEETKEEDAVKWRELEQRKVEDLIRKIGIQGKVEVRHRAGRQREEGAKPRPVIVKAEDDEMRERVLQNARKLSTIEETKKVYIAPDLTPQQREEDRKKEASLKEEAEKRTRESGKKHLVVGPRGRRRVWEVVERETGRR